MELFKINYYSTKHVKKTDCRTVLVVIIIFTNKVYRFLK